MSALASLLVLAWIYALAAALLALSLVVSATLACVAFAVER